VVPPPSFRPPFALDRGTNGVSPDSFRFAIRKQLTSHLCMRLANRPKVPRSTRVSECTKVNRAESMVPVVLPVSATTLHALCNCLQELVPYRWLRGRSPAGALNKPPCA